MKKTLILALSVAGAVGAYAQGTVNFSEAGDATILIYAPSTATPGVQVTGNSATDTPAGSTVYTGAPLGGSATGSGSSGYANGNNYTAELYGAAGSVSSFSGLTALTQYQSTFSTKTKGAGQFIGTSGLANDPGIPGATSTVTLSLAAWYSNGGQFPTLASAEAANVPYGWSPLFSTLSGPLGGTGTPPATPPDLTGLQSFSLITPTPEPGTIALCVMGAGALIARRRNSK